MERTPGRIVPLISDTETKPTAAMRQAIASAEVGDEQRGEDPTVNELQRRVAVLLDKEAALWFPGGTSPMAPVTYDPEVTALLVIDPYNDFISEGGKIWDRLKGVAESNQCVPNMLRVLGAAREAGLRVFYALHHRYRPGDYETWKYVAPIQKAGWSSRAFEDGSWGGEIRRGFEPQKGDIVAHEHWCSSGFANTDLDLQLKKHRIHRLIVMGLIAHTCVEATVRYAAELGYDVTVVRDATADYSDVEMHAALDVNLPNYAGAIVTAAEIVDAIAAPVPKA